MSDLNTLFYLNFKLSGLEVYFFNLSLRMNVFIYVSFV